MFSKAGNRRSEADAARAMPSILARDLRVVGNLHSDGDIQIDGAVEGDIRTGRLTIGESGRVRGAVEAETVTVAGALNGAIKARTVALLRSARVVADIVQEQLSIEVGASFEGSSRRFSQEEAERAKPPAGNGPVMLKAVDGGGAA
jgi:cytoskeletal protein CcmA (bactofilin family)